jgi:hypothetical protein
VTCISRLIRPLPSSRDENRPRSARRLSPRLVTGGIVALVLPAHMLCAFLVARLLLAALVADDSLIGARIGPWPLGRLWHALLPAMLAALILRTFQIVFFRHALFS